MVRAERKFEVVLGSREAVWELERAREAKRGL